MRPIRLLNTRGLRMHGALCATLEVAAFLDRDRARAEERAHLTARQAGELARMAKVKKLQIFHFSPKYEKEGDLLEREAAEAFGG